MHRAQVDGSRRSGLGPNASPLQALYSSVFALAEAPAHTYLNVFTVEEYENNGKTAKKWTKIGAAFPHKEGLGFSIELRAFPVDGRLVVLPPDPSDDRTK